MIVVDAGVLIAYLDRSDAHHQRATALLQEQAEDGFATSPITMAEVLVGPVREGAGETIMNRLAQIPIGTVELGTDAPLRLATLRARTALRMPDCCVLLAAEQVSARVLTFDHRLAGAAVGRGLRVIPTEP
ncbi:type II toxin-antitoxin system VapC family toxin [Microlunatus speluncae]|uniref:type II toxin-antitoxin system VapC family toxin n=1 Tax=Microlunatus speluncae TaxID=2594267 RepID=UPI001375DA85|nr:type II toxin-antitoxin system VapC family toxin [Microlunatus speluncae]